MLHDHLAARHRQAAAAAMRDRRMMREQAPDEAIVGVRFRPYGRVHYFDAAELALSVGDTVLVETECGSRQGRVAIAPGQVLHSDLRGPLGRVLGKVDEDAI